MRAAGKQGHVWMANTQPTTALCDSSFSYVIILQSMSKLLWVLVDESVQQRRLELWKRFLRFPELMLTRKKAKNHAGALMEKLPTLKALLMAEECRQLGMECVED
jgi:hypothetical protein